MVIVVVSPYSPKWNNIASLRWERLSKYLSFNNQVYLLTSTFPEKRAYRVYDIGNSMLIEIPLKKFRRNPHVEEKNTKTAKETVLKSFEKRAKFELGFLLQFLLPISSGGVLVHDYPKYFEKARKIIDSELKNGNTKVVLITTFDPWFSIKLGRTLKKMYKDRLLWVADFRDSSFNSPESKISALPHFMTETKKSLEECDAVLTVTLHMQKVYEKLVGQKVYFIPNGFDTNTAYDFTERSITCASSNTSVKSVKIAYTGSLYKKTRNLIPFIKALSRIVQSTSLSVQFTYAGKDFKEVQRQFEAYGMEKLLVNRGLVSREESLEIQKEADLLLLVAYTGEDERIGCSIRTGKIYEYLSTLKPILVIAPRCWEMREEVEVDGVSKVFDKEEINEIATFITDFAEKKGQVDLSKRLAVLEKYRYSNLAIQVEKIILTIAGQSK